MEREAIRQRWEVFGSKLNERGRRLSAAAEARTAGRGGPAAVAQITGLARSTIGRGLNDPDMPGPGNGRVRRKGAGRRAQGGARSLIVMQRWCLTCSASPNRRRWAIRYARSDGCQGARPSWLRRCARQVMPCVPIPSPGCWKQGSNTRGKSIARRTGGGGTNHPDRDAQFEHIDASVLAAQAVGQAVGQAVIPVDTRKQEEGVDRQLPQWWQRLSAERQSGLRQCA